MSTSNRKLSSSEQEKIFYFLKKTKDEALSVHCYYLSMEHMIVLFKLAGRKTSKEIDNIQSNLKRYIDILEKFSTFTIYEGVLIMEEVTYYEHIPEVALLRMKEYLQELEMVSLRLDILDYFGFERRHVNTIAKDILEFL